MTYDALTIDTQVVYQNGHRLKAGLVGQLDQYKDGLVKFVLSEIVCREIKSMLIEDAKSTIDALAACLKDGSRNSHFSKKQIEEIGSFLTSIQSPDVHAKDRLKDFVDSTGAIIVPANMAPMDAVLTAYFSKAPPFSNKGKKSEFPDAIAILSIEAWAKKENKKVLAVSKDGDWKTFAAKSPWIDCVEDLGEAMSKLAEAAGTVRPDAHAVLRSLIDGTAPAESKSTLDRDIANSIESETPYVEFDSSTQAEDEGASLSLIEYSFPDTDADEIEIVRMRSDGFVMKVPIEITAAASADISFYTRDPVDKDYLPLGSSSIHRNVEFEAFALIDCERISDHTAAKTPASKYQVTSAELVGVPASIDLGYVEPYDDEEDYFEDFGPLKE